MQPRCFSKFEKRPYVGVKCHGLLLSPYEKRILSLDSLNNRRSNLYFCQKGWSFKDFPVLSIIYQIWTNQMPQFLIPNVGKKPNVVNICLKKETQLNRTKTELTEKREKERIKTRFDPCKCLPDYTNVLNKMNVSFKKSLNGVNIKLFHAEF